MKPQLSTLFLTVFTLISTAVISVELAAVGLPQRQEDIGLGGERFTDLGSPISLRTNQKILSMCDLALSAPYAMFQPEPARRQIRNSCAEYTSGVIRWMPTHGFAYFIAAQAAHHGGDLGERNKLLKYSQEFAPFEGWLSERRFALVANQLSSEKSLLSGVIYHDAKVLLYTQSGVELLADFYIHRPETRAIITEASLQASPPNQTRFLNQVRLKQARK